MASTTDTCFYCRGGAAGPRDDEGLGQLVCGSCYAHQVILTYQGRQSQAAALAVAEAERLLRAGGQ